MYGRQKRSKYGSRKVHFAGMTFDSTLEYERWLYLSDLERQHKIRNLERQTPFVLIEDVTGTREKQLKTKTRTETYVIEKGCRYLADFTYEKPVGDDWVCVIEDTKSEATRKKESYVIKRKLMRVHGNVVREVMRATEEI